MDQFFRVVRAAFAGRLVNCAASASAISQLRSFLCFLTGLWLFLCMGIATASPGNDDARRDQWMSYGGNDAQQRFSPLTAINTETVGKLGLQWALDLSKETALVSTPLMVGDTLYFTGKFSVIYAVDARTGKVRWTFDPKAREELAKVARRMTYNWGTSRGLAYWRGAIIVASVDGRLMSISAGTGRLLWSTKTIDTTVDYLYISGAPMVFGDKVLIGNGGGDFGAARGYVTAYSAQSGKELWRFFTVPGNPANGFEDEAQKKAAATWGPDWWKTTGGGNVWNAMTFDPEFSRVYIGTGNGSPWNQNVHGRADGDNLYVASIIALDADTGRYVWHYQAIPGDNWDFDSTQDMILADIRIGTDDKKVLMQANKDGFFYIIDRRTGKLISAEAFAHVTWADHVDLKTGRPVERPGMRPDGPSSRVIAVWPWTNGAHNWPSMSYSPYTGLTYIPGMDVMQIFDARGIDPDTYKPDRVEQWIGYSDIVGRDARADTVAAQSEPFDQSAFLQARDPRTNKAVWQVKQPGLWAGGTLATAGNLVFIGQADGNLAAYDAKSGRELWKYNCGRPISASPISYQLDGKQYVAVLVGWGGMPAVEGMMGTPGYQMTYRDGGRRLVAFALGGTAKLTAQPIQTVKLIDVPEFTPQEAKVRRGEHLFDNNCNLCHGTDAFSGGQAPDLRGSTLAADRKTLSAVVLGGALLSQGMPQYVDFTEDDIDALYHYIRYRARKDICTANAKKPDAALTGTNCTRASD